MFCVSVIGSARAITHRSGRKIWLMNGNEAVLWELYRDGVTVSEIARALAVRFGVEPDMARSHVQQAYDSWKAMGLTEASECEFDTCAAMQKLPDFAAASLSLPKPGALRLRIAERYVSVSVSDAELRALVSALLPHVLSEDYLQITVPAWDDVCVTGSHGHWQIWINGVAHVDGEGADFLVAVLNSCLAELGCDTGERLFVMHGAGLVSPAGVCLLMSAQGGAGKTTLAIGLEAEGFKLMSDDVVPISTGGAALGLGLPACVKSGSWDVLSGYRPDILALPDLVRFGEGVRYLPPRKHPFTSAIAPSLLLWDCQESCARGRLTFIGL